MRSYPVADPGQPDHRSPLRYLLWLARVQAGTMTVGAVYGIIWMISQALMPAVLGRAIDTGVTAKDTHALVAWSGALFGLGVVQAIAGVMRHRFAVTSWLGAAYRTIQVIVRQATRLGGTLPARMATGEVVSVGIVDVSHLGNAMDITARGSGAVVAIAVVGVILLSASPPLGLMVLVGVPLMAVAVTPLLRPLHRRQHRYRDLQGELATRAGDIMVGLRVLRGIGGEEVFTGRYRVESQRVRHAGVRVARVESLLEAAQVLLPGLLVALVTWLAARYAAAGEITLGQLVAFYGYAVFLAHPVRTLTETADKITKAYVAARRAVWILQLEPEPADQGTASASGPGELVDAESGLVVRPGRLTAVAAAVPADAEVIADRLGRYIDGETTYAGVPLRDLPMADVRELILVVGNHDRLFSGSLREVLDPKGTTAENTLGEALDTADARDVVDALPAGLDSHVAEGGREFSGGQRQRLRLVRALLADPDVLVLVEPTAAVDAHTEARIAGRLAKARGGRTTVVCSTSPLMLDRVDHVVYVEDGKVLAEGTHRELLTAEPRYAATVTRGEDD